MLAVSTGLGDPAECMALSEGDGPWSIHRGWGAKRGPGEAVPGGSPGHRPRTLASRQVTMRLEDGAARPRCASLGLSRSVTRIWDCEEKCKRGCPPPDVVAVSWDSTQVCPQCCLRSKLLSSWWLSQWQSEFSLSCGVAALWGVLIVTGIEQISQCSRPCPLSPWRGADSGQPGSSTTCHQ